MISNHMYFILLLAACEYCMLSVLRGVMCIVSFGKTNEFRTSVVHSHIHANKAHLINCRCSYACAAHMVLFLNRYKGHLF